MLLALITGMAVAALAFAAGALTPGGAVAAAAVGALCVLAGWGWAALLIVYFIVAVACSRIGARTKERRTGGVVAKAGRRDAIQVVANGGVFAAAAFFSHSSPTLSTALEAAALGALAAASADTIATEIGTLVGGEPRSIIGGHAVPAGTSGGVTLAGSLGMVAGALLVAAAARALGLGSRILIVVTAGVIGALTDSLLGALVQERRHCPRCDRATERRVHDCGALTERSGGVPWLDNDLVNLAATIVGAVVAAMLVVV